MVNNSSNQEHIQAFESLFNSIGIIYSIYQPYFKGILLIFTSYFAFRFGKFTVKDSIDISTNELSNTLTNRVQYTVFIPRRIKRIHQIKKWLTVLLVICAISMLAAYYLAPKYFTIFNNLITIMGFIVLFLAVLFLGSYELLLNYWLKNGTYNDRKITDKINELLKMFGSKVAILLKTNLCREKILSHKNGSLNICSKNQCREERVLLRARYAAIMNLVESVLSFEWCSVCKKRQIFDEFLSFENQEYVVNSENEEEQVNERNKFLSNQIERMMEWLKEVHPCNCSKLYWSLSMKEVLEYRRFEKNNEEKIAMLEQKDSKRVR